MSCTPRSWQNIATIAYVFAIDALYWLSSIYLSKCAMADPFDQSITITRLRLDNLFASDFVIGFCAIVGLVLVIKLVAELELVIQVL